jgi:hypothetical protein
MGNRGARPSGAVFMTCNDSKLLKPDPGFVAGNKILLTGQLFPAILVLARATLLRGLLPTPTASRPRQQSANLMLQTDAPLFTVGHGYQRTVPHMAPAKPGSLAAPVPDIPPTPSSQPSSSAR